MGIVCLIGGHNYVIVEETEDTITYQCTKCLDRTRSTRRKDIVTGEFGDWRSPL